MTTRVGRAGLTAVALVMAATGLPAQSATNPERAQVLILGSYHFANPGRDIAQQTVDDVLLPARQAEIRDIVEALATFRPTKIAIEAPSAMTARIDSLFRAYRSGSRELSRDESQQLGFRLAARFDHAGLYPIDYDGDFPFGAMMDYAKVHNPEFVTFVDEELARIATESNRRQRENTIGEILRFHNSRAALAEDHGIYLRFADIGAGDTYVGADLVAKWYERNIRIFANLRRIVEPGDRILVIYGAGHAPILRELVASHPGLLLVDALEYLPPQE